MARNLKALGDKEYWKDFEVTNYFKNLNVSLNQSNAPKQIKITLLIYGFNGLEKYPL
ncbi:MAG: hypothetical protein ACRBF0_18870 [Calditrichia bacterium]